MRGRVGSHSTFIAAVALIAMCSPANAQASEDWSIFRGEGGLVAEFPAGIFTKDAGPTEKGAGRRYTSDDGRYEFAGYTLPNPNRESPRSYLRKKLILNPSTIIYRRVIVSSCFPACETVESFTAAATFTHASNASIWNIPGSKRRPGIAS